MSEASVDSIRQGIDECDEQLLLLLKKRQQLVEQLAQVKREKGDALYVPEREKKVLARIQQQAKNIELEPALASDVMQRIFRNSYQLQSQMRFSRSCEQVKKVAVIGGRGKLGALFAEHFQRSAYDVVIIEKDSTNDEWAQLKLVDLVLVAVPIEVTESVIQQLTGLNKNCVVADITSHKQKPLGWMMEVHSGPVIGLHPMFGPGCTTLARQLMLFCHGREAESCQWLIEQFSVWGCLCREVEATQHDEVMSIVQALRHFCAISAGQHLLSSQADIGAIAQMSSPVYRMELAFIGRLFAQNPELYVDILLNSSQGVEVIESYSEQYQSLLALLKNKDRTGLLKCFNEVKEYLGDYAEDFLQESNRLLAAASERN
ncbi:bifunctional chorismate mutase/prephenate dehydrogenase [Pleionea sp. CnH1-48]|uniref:bifunctional chorismate mutase/prephenate dehydrogenase n=1 Tax=Pleionea sp. CnH1-48 TaxID=2954494 RepID=UPI0020984501|nr:bifunctional chorismate mutase/prephenate dehydrogenase [Pleionea sp. CnH1-48]MCO7226416.1 bifunctional chorismate mutase/prephenate dehydrogenase [Pleionea sp. CnH1-48]